MTRVLFAVLYIALGFALSVAAGQDPRVKWLKIEPEVKNYIFPASIANDVRLCIELPAKRLGCITAEKIRLTARDGVPR